MIVLETWIIAVLLTLALVLVGIANGNRKAWWFSPDRQHSASRIAAVLQGLQAIRGSSRSFDQLDHEISDRLSLLPFGSYWRAKWLWAKLRKRWTSEPGAALDALIRSLEARHAAAVGAQNSAFSGPPSRASAISDTPVTGLEPREAALLVAVSKSFYESWAFKGLSAALVAGLALGVGGDFILGGKSYQLSGQLQQTYDRAASEIGKRQDQALAQIDKATEQIDKGADLLKTTNAAVQKQADQFSIDAARAIAKLKEDQQSFEERLKADTVARVTADLRQAIANRTGPISERIDTEDEGLKRRFAALVTRSDGLDTAADRLDLDFDSAKARAVNLEPRLSTLERDASTAERLVGRIHGADGAAGDAKRRAEEAAASASQAQGAAAANRDRLTAQLDAFANAIPPQSAALAAITVAVATLRQDLQRATDSLAGTAHDAAKLQEISGTLKAVVERIAKLETSKDPPPPADGRIHDNLTAAERCAVQRQLNGNGFASGPIDGTLGERTTRAIQRWQQSIGKAETGRLEPEQIDSLIGKRGSPAPPCPKR